MQLFVPERLRIIKFNPHIDTGARVVIASVHLIGSQEVFAMRRCVQPAHQSSPALLPPHHEPASEVYHLMIASACVTHRDATTFTTIHDMLLCRPNACITHEPAAAPRVDPGAPQCNPLVGLWGLARVATGLNADAPLVPLRYVRVDAITTQLDDSAAEYLASVGPVFDNNSSSPLAPDLPKSDLVDVHICLSRDQAFFATALFASWAQSKTPRHHDLSWLSHVAIPSDPYLDDRHRTYARIETFGRSLPDDPVDLLQAGLVAYSRYIPDDLHETYRTTLGSVAYPASHGCVGALKMLLLFDAFIRTIPPLASTDSELPRPQQHAAHRHLEERLRRFQDGDFHALWDSVTRRSRFDYSPRVPANQSPSSPLALASKAQHAVQVKRSVTAAAKCLRSPCSSASPPADPTPLIQSLNPQPGEPFQDMHGHIVGLRNPFPPPLPPVSQLPPRSRAMQFSTIQLCQSVSKTDTGSAGGPDGNDFFSLRLWWAQEDHLSDDLTVIVNLILTAQVPWSFRHLLVCSRLVLIPKDDQRWRPISVGNTLLRFVCSSAMRRALPSISRHFSAYQFGCGTKSGTEQIHFMSSHILNSNTDFIYVSADAQNAFNSFDRSALVSPVIQHFPELFWVVWLIYLSSPSDQLFELKPTTTDSDPEYRSMPSSVGSRQGCPFGSWLYALAVHAPILVNNPYTCAAPDPTGQRALCLAFADDVSFIGPPDVVAQAFRWHAQQYTSVLQGTIRPQKSHVFCPHHLDRVLEIDEAFADFPELRQAPRSYSGIRLLGSPLGTTEYVNKYVTEVCNNIREELTLINSIPSFQVRHTLTRYATIERISHIMRTTPLFDPDLRLQPVVHRLDRCLRHTVSSYAASTYPPQLDDLGWLLSQLPGKLGGIGVPSHSSRCDPAFLSAYNDISHLWRQRVDDQGSPVQVLPTADSLFPADDTAHPNPDSSNVSTGNTACMLPTILAVRKAISRLRHTLPDLQPPPSEHTPKLQHSIMDLLHLQTRHNHVIRNPELSKFRKAVHTSACGDSYTHSTCPYSYRSRVPNLAWLVMTSRRLLQKIPDLVSAPKCSRCRAKMGSAYASVSHASSSSSSVPPERDRLSAEHGDLALVCPEHGRTTYWHNAVRDCFVWCMQVSFPEARCQAEPAGMYPGTDTRRPDALVSGAGGLPPQVVDFRSCTPVGAHLGPRTCLQPGWSLEAGEKAKRNDWAATLRHRSFRDNHHEFTPFCVEEGGRLGNDAENLLQKLDSCLPPVAGSLRRPGFSFWSRHLALATSRGVGQLILYHINSRDPDRCSPRFRTPHKTAGHNALFCPRPRHPPPDQDIALGPRPSFSESAPSSSSSSIPSPPTSTSSRPRNVHPAAPVPVHPDATLCLLSAADRRLVPPQSQSLLLPLGGASDSVAGGAASASSG